jgi:hypothetical protein
LAGNALAAKRHAGGNRGETAQDRAGSLRLTFERQAPRRCRAQRCSRTRKLSVFWPQRPHAPFASLTIGGIRPSATLNEPQHRLASRGHADLKIYCRSRVGETLNAR